MKIAFDTETRCFAPGYMAPHMVCFSYAVGSTQVLRKGLWHVKQAEPKIATLFQSAIVNQIPLIGQNTAYDMAVISHTYPDLADLVWDCYDANVVRDTIVRQKLIDIATGRYRGFRAENGVWVPLSYSLADLARRHLKKDLDKDTWRLRYAELEPLPLAKWPEGAKYYSTEDAVTTLEVYWSQDAAKDRYPREAAYFFRDEIEQTKHAWWLHLMSVQGIHTEPKAVQRLAERARAELDRTGKILEEYGLLVKGKRKVGKVRDRLQYLHDTEGLQLRYTDNGQIVTDSDACRESGDPLLHAYCEYTSNQKTLSADVAAFSQGFETPIHSRFESLAKTGRTTSSKPNIQNVGKKAGVRECFRSRTGLFAAADYSGLELRTLAQVCLRLVGYSRLAEMLNAGIDPHLSLGATILGISYDEAARRLKAKDKQVKDARQLAKPGNFGFPGGMQNPDKMVLYARKNYGVRMTPQFAEQLRKHWLDTYPEMVEYFRVVETWRMPSDPSDRLFSVEHLFSGRLATKLSWNDAHNYPFQGLGADATKAAGYLITRACYRDKASPLYGCRPVNYIHDEFLLEVPPERGHECAIELGRLMVVGASPFLPDVPPVAEPLLMSVWSKDAEPTFGPDGRLIPWTPAEAS